MVSGGAYLDMLSQIGALLELFLVLLHDIFGFLQLVCCVSIPFHPRKLRVVPYDEEQHLLVNLVLQSRRFIGLYLQLVNLSCQVRNQMRMLVKLGFCHGEVIFTLLADILLILQTNDSR